MYELIRGKLYCGYSAKETWILNRGNIYCGYSSEETCIVGTLQKHLAETLTKKPTAYIFREKQENYINI